MLSRCPFPQECELVRVGNETLSSDILSMPSPRQLLSASQGVDRSLQACVPGQPGLPLSDIASVISFLEKDLLTPELDAMAPHLWMMSTQSSSNINALHHQLLKGRRIAVTENPRLHLV